jgi:uncharacterized protein (TIGR02646 family)
MIHIKRDRLDDNGVPIRPPQSWFDSAADMTEVAEDEKGDHKVEETVYRHINLKRALLALFHEKCAYCESKMVGFDWEVEHFRPKGKVEERPEHPGYYWLAYKWENLYTGCTFCNQRRRDRGTWEDPQGGPAAGKMAQFPLRDEDYRAMDHNQDIAQEEDHRLLIDPCVDEHPEDDLTFDLNGDVLPVGNSDVGEKTVEALHLDRTDINERRRDHINLILGTIEDLVEELSAADPDTIRDIILKQFSQDNQPYAGVVREIQRNPQAFDL